MQGGGGMSSQGVGFCGCSFCGVCQCHWLRMMRMQQTRLLTMPFSRLAAALAELWSGVKGTWLPVRASRAPTRSASTRHASSTPALEGMHTG